MVAGSARLVDRREKLGNLKQICESDKKKNSPGWHTEKCNGFIIVESRCQKAQYNFTGMYNSLRYTTVQSCELVC